MKPKKEEYILVGEKPFPKRIHHYDMLFLEVKQLTKDNEENSFGVYKLKVDKHGNFYYSLKREVKMKTHICK